MAFPFDLHKKSLLSLELYPFYFLSFTLMSLFLDNLLSPSFYEDFGEFLPEVD